MEKVVITGIGVVSPIGTGASEFFQGLGKSVRGVDHIKSFNTEFFPSSFGAEVKENGQVVNSHSAVDRKEVFIIRAMEELYNTSQIKNYKASDRLLHLGAGIDYFDFPGYVKQRIERDWSDFSLRSNKVVEKLARNFEIKGGYFTNVSACVASTQAMGLAWRILRKSPEKAIITGGFDSMLSHLHYMGFYNLGALSEWKGEPSGACRPFDKKRCGLVIGEGAVAYLFESEKNAMKESVFCEVAGYGSTMDAYMVTDPDPTGKNIANAAFEAIRNAGITPDDIDAIDMHGTGTVKNALAEVKAIELIFKNRFKEIPVFTMKGQIGHLIGACGAMEILGVIDALKHQRILPSVNCDEPDPEMPLYIVRGEPLSLKINNILKINAAFGGQNTAMVFRKYGE